MDRKGCNVWSDFQVAFPRQEVTTLPNKSQQRQWVSEWVSVWVCEGDRNSSQASLPLWSPHYLMVIICNGVLIPSFVTILVAEPLMYAPEAGHCESPALAGLVITQRRMLSALEPSGIQRRSAPVTHTEVVLNCDITMLTRAYFFWPLHWAYKTVRCLYDLKWFLSLTPLPYSKPGLPRVRLLVMKAYDELA
jgi:hypothetical protein